jgi:hypothetical protein
MIEFVIKMIGIFPEKTFQLIEIRDIVSNFKITNFKIKFILAQLDTVILKREFVESFKFTKYLNEVSKTVNHCISDLKAFFSSIINGEVSQQLGQLSMIISCILRVNSIFKDIHFNFPFQTNAMKLESKFLSKVKGDKEQNDNLLQKINSINETKKSEKDQIYHQGGRIFQYLFSRFRIYSEFHESSSTTLHFSISSSDRQSNQTLLLFDELDQLNPPSIRISFLLSFLAIFLFLLLPIILFFIFRLKLSSYIDNPTKSIVLISRFMIYFSILNAVSLYYSCQKSFLHFSCPCDEMKKQFQTLSNPNLCDSNNSISFLLEKTLLG